MPERSCHLDLVRHAETQWNLEGRLQGRGDSPLTSNGIAKVRLVSQQLNVSDYDGIYASPAGRVRSTCRELGIREDQINFLPDLAEMHLGDWEGKTRTEIATEYPELFNCYCHYPAKFTAPGGESYVNMEQRIVKCTSQLAMSHAGQRILVLSHGMVLKTLINYLDGRMLDDLSSAKPLKNCEIVPALIRVDS